MEPIISQLWNIGPSAGLLGLAVWYFWSRDKRNDASSDAKHKHCEDRNTKLDARILALEDRQFVELAVIAREGFAGLSNSTAAIKRFLRDDSSTPPQAFHAHHKDH